MSKPKIFVGVGTEVVLQALLPTAQRLTSRDGTFPADTFIVMGDSDRRSEHRVAQAKLAADRVHFAKLSLSAVKEALSRRREEFRDCWREDWLPMIKTAPDNGACMLPSLGRLMVKAARSQWTQTFTGIKRRLEGETPDIFVVMNPLSGTSRGATVDLPRYLRYVWPEAMITALLVYPIDLQTVDDRGARIYKTNFVEALRIIEHHTQPREYQVYMDPKVGWETRKGALVNNVLAFDSRYGNTRLSQLGDTEHRLEGGLSQVFEQVCSFLVGVGQNERMADWMLGRLSDVTLHRSTSEVAGHRTICHAVHETRLGADVEAFREALIARGMERILGPLAGKGGGKSSEQSLTDGYFG